MREHIYSNINEAAYAAMVERKQREHRRRKVQKQLAEAFERYQAKEKTARCGDTEAVDGK